MSLIHWWPLNGDLLDRGSNPKHGSIIGSANVTTSGILGKCLSGMSGSQTTAGVSVSNCNLLDEISNEYSAAMWIKVHGTHVHYEGAFISSGDWNNKRWTFGINQANNRIQPLTNASNQNYISLGKTLTNDQWYHVATVYKDGKASLYLDGILINTITATAPYQSSATNLTIGRETYASGYFSFNGDICDVRVYDHALSVAEVKELSKGLMIHYTFNDTGNEATINLLPSSQQTQSNSAATIEVTSDLTQGGTYTLSTYITRQPECTSTNPRLTLRFFYSDGTSTATSKYNDGGTSYPKDGVERFYFITATANASKTLTKIGGWLMDHTNGTGKKMTATKSQLELSDHPTTYTPTSRACIAFDDSGNGYDAKGHNIAMNTNTNNGTLAAKFNGSTSYFEVPVPRSNMFSTPYTLSFWVNPDDNDRAIYFGDHSTVGGVSMNFERKSGGKMRYYHGGSPDKELNISAPVGSWTMLTITSDGTNMRAYENGVLKETYQFTPTITKSSGHMRIGRDNRSDYTALAGYMSDFRWYATALSDDDIKILYESKAAVDKESNFYTNEFIEVNTSTVDITNKYTIKTNEIIEGQENGFYKDGHMTSNTIYEI